MSLYLDNNATTRPADAVAEAMDRLQREAWANPSSVHRAGQTARRSIELARQAIANLIGTRPRFITFTGSGTEAIDLAVRGHLLATGAIGRRAEQSAAPVGTLITTRAEHSAVRELAVDLERHERIRVLWANMLPDGSGRVDVADIERLLDGCDTGTTRTTGTTRITGHAAAPVVVSIQWANNETGAIQPVDAVGALCAARRDRAVIFHCDATQWVGKMPTDLAAGPPCDLLTFSPHKFHGPKGIGVLYTRPGVRIAPLIHGEQELGRRGGTENAAAIVGSGVAATLAASWLADPAAIEHGRALRDRFEAAILHAIPDASVNGPTDAAHRLWNTSSIAFPRLEAEALLLLLSEHGVCCSAGAACSSGSLEPSSVLLATGIPPASAHGSLRFSLSRETTADEVDRAAAIITTSANRLRQSMASLL